mgnify:CR=1 FL=1
MAISRYQDLKNEKFDYINTFPAIKIDDIISNDDFFYTIKDKERIDQISRKFLSDGRYWWAICIVNNLSNPFQIKPGSIIRIPRDINKILSKL